MTFQPTGLGLEIFHSRHAAHPEETWAEGCARVATHVSNAESGTARSTWRAAFESALLDNLFMPGGRIWYGSGRARGQLLNCVSGDTPVNTRQGLRRARDLHGVVETLSQDGRYRPATWSCFGLQELFWVEFADGGYVEATAGHQWPVVTANGIERVTTLQLEGRRVLLQGLHNDEWLIHIEQHQQGVLHGIAFAKLDGSLGVPSIPADTRSYVLGFLAGYVSIEGGVTRDGVVQVSHPLLPRLAEIQDLAHSLGFFSSGPPRLPSFDDKITREKDRFYLWLTPHCVHSFADKLDKLLLNQWDRDAYRSVTKDLIVAHDTVKVLHVKRTDKVELVYCCNEPETHTWVTGNGYLTGNCFVVPTNDSREGWGRTISDTIVISGTGGGVGVNFSPTRPRGSQIAGTGGTATGAVSEMEMVNGVGNVIKAGGGRRVALMFALGLSHGDIREFMDKKLDRNELNNANVSVVFDDDPEDFFKVVREDGTWDLKHNGRVVGAIPARALWQRLVENAVKPRDGQGGGEPGLLNGYLANRMSNIWYLEKLVCTNPCGEIWMSPYDCCCLGAVVLSRFVKTGKMQWDLLRNTVATGVRFLDDVLTVNNYPLPDIADKCAQLRRIGLGVTGLHHMLLELGLGYNTPAGLEFVDKLMSFIKNASYEASSELAAEKGSFPAFRAEQFLQSKFVKLLKPSLRARIQLHGMRNCAVNTIAPVGTGSMVCNVSSAIEPIFAPAYERRFRRGDEIAKEIVLDPMFARFEAEGRDTSHFLGAHELSMRDHLEMQRTCQRHIDNAVSKTINLPSGTSTEELSELYMEYLPELKGVTVYPDGSREDQPLTPLSRDRALQLVADATMQAAGQDSCRSGVCEI